MTARYSAAIGVTVACAVPMALFAQLEPTFEVASIRRSTSATPGGSSSRMQPGGSYIATNMTVQQLIAAAYGIPTTRVFDGPGWVSADRYDISVDWASGPEVDGGVSVFTAVQEQLGLKLESTTAPLDVVVIERVERPTEN